MATRAQLESKKTAAQADKNDAEQAVKDINDAIAVMEKSREMFADKVKASEGAAREAEAEIKKL